MPWIRFEDNFPEHPKVLDVTDAAFRLHVRAVAYCSRLLTDGLVSLGSLASLKPGRWGVRLADELVEAGIWERADEGYVIHDYLHYQPSREQIETKRAADRSRKSHDGIRSGSARNRGGFRNAS